MSSAGSMSDQAMPAHASSLGLSQSRASDTDTLADSVSEVSKSTTKGSPYSKPRCIEADPNSERVLPLKEGESRPGRSRSPDLHVHAESLRREMDTSEQADTDSIHRTSGNCEKARSKASSGAGSRGGSRAGSAESSSRQNPLSTPSGSSRRPPQPYSGQASRSCMESDASLQAMPGGSRGPMTPGVDPVPVGTGSTLGSFLEYR